MFKMIKIKTITKDQDILKNVDICKRTKKEYLKTIVTKIK